MKFPALGLDEPRTFAHVYPTVDCCPTFDTLGKIAHPRQRQTLNYLQFFFRALNPSNQATGARRY
ncbi:MAG: hypothetical protein DME26_01220 [Verrucomicrobia bacterium]|nr:MAG: hypothetical protein DME26_01220 [Verrucomicrobiota bacterium]